MQYDGNLKKDRKGENNSSKIYLKKILNNCRGENPHNLKPIKPNFIFKNEYSTQF